MKQLAAIIGIGLLAFPLFYAPHKRVSNDKANEITVA